MVGRQGLRLTTVHKQHGEPVGVQKPPNHTLRAHICHLLSGFKSLTWDKPVSFPSDSAPGAEETTGLALPGCLGDEVGQDTDERVLDKGQLLTGRAFTRTKAWRHDAFTPGRRQELSRGSPGNRWFLLWFEGCGFGGGRGGFLTFAIT